MRSYLRRARAGPRLLRGIMGRHPRYGCQNLGHVLRRCRIEAVAQSLGAGSSLVCAVVGWVSDWAARLASTFSAGQRFRDRRSCVSEACAPEFEQVVGAGDQLPFGLTGGEAAAEEAVGAPDAFCVREDRFDDLLAFAVERLPFGCRQHRLDPLRLVALAG